MRQLLRGAALGVSLLIPALMARAETPVTAFTLDNGMDVVVIEDHRAPVVTHMVWYRVGAADEPWGKSGIAHFFEHLMFKETDDLGPNEFNQIVSENGGQQNAFTSYDYTAYFQRIAADRLGLMMSLEAERMTDLVLDEEGVATERDVILEERNQRTDNNPQGLFSEQMRNFFFQNHPYKVPVIGWRHEIENLNLEDAKAFYERYYAPDNAILVVAGDVTVDEVRALAEEHYGPLEPSGRPADARPQEPPARAPRRMAMTDPDVRQPYMQRFYRAPNYDPENPEESAALSLATSVLGAGITSMFGQQLETEGLAIDTGAFYSAASRDPLGFGVWAVPAEGVSLAELEVALDAVIADLQQNGPDPELLERIKRKLRADLIFEQDSLSGLARRYGRLLSMGLTVEDIKAWPGVVQSITPEQVRAVAETYLVPEGSATGWMSREPQDPPGAARANDAGGEKEAG